MKNKRILILLILVCVIFSGCVKKDVKPKSENGIFLNSVLQLQLYDHDNEKIRRQVFNYLEDFEKKVSLNLEDSQLCEINRNSGIKPVKVDDDVFDIIKKSIYYSELSDGAFDITIEPVASLWAIGTDRQRVPKDQEIKDKLKYVDYRKIKLDEKEKTVYLEQKGMAIDLGAIAKGYAADRIKDILRENKVNSAIINLGGNILVYGSKGNEPFGIGLQKPFGALTDYIAVLKSVDETVVTSGNYERYFEQDGKRYHHILSTKTGYPVENDLNAAVIIAKSSVDADALSTSVFALGIEKGQKLIDSLKDVDVVFITKENRIIAPESIKNRLKIKDPDFKYLN